MRDKEARDAIAALKPLADRLASELDALRDAYNELADEMMRLHGIEAKTYIPISRFWIAVRAVPVSPRRFAYDVTPETRTIRREPKTKRGPNRG